MTISIDALAWLKDKLQCHPYFFNANHSPSTTLKTSYWGFVEQLLNASTLEDVGAIVRTMAQHYGYNHFSVAFVYPAEAPDFVCHHFFQNASEWALYYRKNLTFIDPFSNHCITQVVPISWCNSHRSEQFLRDVSPEVISAFHGFGIRNVLSIPYHGPCRTMGCLRLMCLNHSGLSQHDMQSTIAELHSLVTYIFEALSRHISKELLVDRAMMPLTLKERQVLLLMIEECSIDEIAKRLTISKNTVLSHSKSLYTKLGVGDRSHAVKRAFGLGIVS